MNIDNKKTTEKLEQIAECIYENLEKMHQDVKGSQGLFTGEFGILLFMYYYSKYSNDKKILDLTHSYTDLLIEKMGIIVGNLDKLNDSTYYTYCGGLAGVLYSLKFLNEKQFIEFDLSDDEVTEHLAVAMRKFVNENNYDYLHGALGIGFYFLKTDERQLVDELIDNLYHTAIIEESENTFKWEMKFNPMRDFDISLSHGVSSVVVFLARAVKSNIAVEKSTKMLNGTVTYILSLEQDFQQIGCHFPTDLGVQKSRLAWCYGDLGIASSVWYAGKVTNNEMWKNKALEVFTNSAKRLSLAESHVQDAGICHGSVGIALIFRRMYIETKNVLFLETARHWINQTLDYATYADGLAGYKTWWIEKWIRDFSLLNGISGIGLTFLSFLSDDSQDWDELFLLS